MLRSPQTVRCNASYEQTMWTWTCTCRGTATGPNDVMRERINTADFVSRCLAMEVVQTPKNAVSGSPLCTPTGVAIIRRMLFLVLISRLFEAWNASKWLDMEMKPTNAYKHSAVSYIINIVTLLHVHISGTLVTFLREVLYAFISFISI